MEFKRKQSMIPMPKCFHCKSSLNINRNENPALLYFNDHYYHEKCFTEMRGIKKKCYTCKGDIIISDSDVECVKYDNHFYHISCFSDWCNEKSTPKRKAAYTHIGQYINEASENVQKLLEDKKIDAISINEFKRAAVKQINDWFAKSDVNSFIRAEYNVAQPPWKRLPQVYDGTYPNLDVPIPAEDLLDMWIQKMPFLRKQNEKLRSKSGMKPSTENLIHYDLAILVSKYNDYLVWKEKQKTLAAEAELEAEKQKIDTGMSVSEMMMRKADDPKQEDETEDMIRSLVDEIFGSYE